MKSTHVTNAGEISASGSSMIAEHQVAIAQLIDRQSAMMKANRLFSEGGVRALQELDQHDEAALAGKQGGTLFPSHVLTQNTVTIRALQDQLGQLTARQDGIVIEHVHEQFEVYTERGQIHVDFAEEPSSAVVAFAERTGFRWSSRHQVLVRPAVQEAQVATKDLIKKLESQFAAGLEKTEL